MNDNLMKLRILTIIFAFAISFVSWALPCQIQPQRQAKDLPLMAKNGQGSGLFVNFPNVSAHLMMAARCLMMRGFNLPKAGFAISACLARPKPPAVAIKRVSAFRQACQTFAFHEPIVASSALVTSNSRFAILAAHRFTILPTRQLTAKYGLTRNVVFGPASAAFTLPLI